MVFSKTEGFRHESISEGIKMIVELGKENGYTVIATEDAEVFNQSELSRVKTIVFLNTTGDVLNQSQELEFQRFIQAGGSFVGIHAAADTEYDWPWYGKLVGGYFASHPSNPNVRSASIDRIDSTHLSVVHLPDRWDRTDEWYNFKNLYSGFTPLLNLDESSYEGGQNGDYHPIAWYHEFDGGRAFYTGGGHTDSSYSEPAFRQHVSGGILWALGDRQAVDNERADRSHFLRVARGVLLVHIDAVRQPRHLVHDHLARLHREQGLADKLVTARYAEPVPAGRDVADE